jgi:hypothetical protein
MKTITINEIKLSQEIIGHLHELQQEGAGEEYLKDIRRICRWIFRMTDGVSLNDKIFRKATSILYDLECIISCLSNINLDPDDDDPDE